MTICLAESRQEAVSTSYLVTLNVKNDGQLALVARSYIDQFRKTGDNWKFSDGESQQTSDQPWTAIDA